MTPFQWGFWATLGHYAAKAALWIAALALLIAIATCEAQMSSSAEWRTALGELDALEVLVLENVLQTFTAQTSGIPTMQWVIASAMLGDVRNELATRAEMERLQGET